MEYAELDIKLVTAGRHVGERPTLFIPIIMTHPFQIFPEFNVDNQFSIETNSPKDLSKYINLDFPDEEFRDISMYPLGNMILAVSKNLLNRANMLLEELGRLGATMDEIEPDDGPDWKELKRQQRANVLREYHARERKKREQWRKLRKLYSKSGAVDSTQEHTDTSVISGFVEPFSASANARRDWDEEIKDLMKVGESRLLPWRPILSYEIASGKTTFTDLTPVIEDARKDTVLKFQFLLELAHENKIELVQKEHFADIKINTDNIERLNSRLTVKDSGGTRYPLDWNDLNRRERLKVIDDLKQGKVMLV